MRVSPPPHPGIPHEQSIKGGVGENGGQLAIDGPTFVATEGWLAATEQTRSAAPRAWLHGVWKRAQAARFAGQVPAEGD